MIDSGMIFGVLFCLAVGGRMVAAYFGDKLSDEDEQ